MHPTTVTSNRVPPTVVIRIETRPNELEGPDLPFLVGVGFAVPTNDVIKRSLALFSVND
jgi:hypothetical protein